MERHSGFIEFNGDGSTTAFSIPHHCSTTPYFISAEASTDDALGIALDVNLTALDTNVKTYTISPNIASGYITVTHPVAPPVGANNLGYWWSAECQ